ncbi:MAG: (2Fe-2S) ferredoxin domain-containing protein [Xenococcus sp. MO_188.B8]|nr:(2Fe-2S) ferredoxin domain-containing protein [Xenococcus sp. MO_188.B8]
MTKESSPNSITILVCQGHTCSLSGSAQVLLAFQINSPSNVKIVGCGCLGQCGNGPMVLFLPEKTWYGEVSFDAVNVIIEQHLSGKKPVVSMLYRKFHPLPIYGQKKALNSFLGWLSALSVILALVLTIVWVLSANQY